ncbi:MAG: DUF2931 family protein [Ferruginibacter sp.]
MEKFKWFPTECAPELYPMRIIRGDFIFKNGESIYIPDSRTINNGWGEVGSIHIVGEELKPLPVRLLITWFSFTEDKFYVGNFTLPYNRILELFTQGFQHPLTGKRTTYTRIIIGMAPGGFISIWLAGNGVVIELCTFEAEETSIDWKLISEDLSKTRKEFIKERLEEVLNADEIAKISKNIPIGLWKKYKTIYSWTLLIIGRVEIQNIWLRFYNGESQFINYKLGNRLEEFGKPVVKKIEIKWIAQSGKKYSGSVFFDEQEIFEAFKKLNPITSGSVKLQIEISDVDQGLKIYLRDEKYILELKKFIIKIYSS